MSTIAIASSSTDEVFTSAISISHIPASNQRKPKKQKQKQSQATASTPQQGKEPISMVGCFLECATKDLPDGNSSYILSIVEPNSAMQLDSNVQLHSKSLREIAQSHPDIYVQLAEKSLKNMATNSFKYLLKGLEENDQTEKMNSLQTRFDTPEKQRTLFTDVNTWKQEFSSGVLSHTIVPFKLQPPPGKAKHKKLCYMLQTNFQFTPEELTKGGTTLQSINGIRLFPIAFQSRKEINNFINKLYSRIYTVLIGPLSPSMPTKEINKQVKALFKNGDEKRLQIFIHAINNPMYKNKKRD